MKNLFRRELVREINKVIENNIEIPTFNISRKSTKKKKMESEEIRMSKGKKIKN